MAETRTTLVALGDSSVEGLDDPDGQGGFVGWCDRLAQHLADDRPDVSYANLAVSGRTAPEVLAEQLEAAVRLRPEVAAVLCGVNDLLRPRFDPALLQDRLEQIFAALRATGAEVITYTQPDPVRLSPLVRPLRPRVFALNAATRVAAARHGVHLLELEPVALAGDPRLWSVDRLHANSEGHRRIAAGCAEVLGLRGASKDWAVPLGPESTTTALQRAAREAAWLRGHLAPYVVRGLRRQSSSAGITAKRPVPTVVRASST